MKEVNREIQLGWSAALLEKIAKEVPSEMTCKLRPEG